MKRPDFLDATKFEQKFTAIKSRTEKGPATATSQTMGVIPWSLSPGLSHEYRMPRQLIDFAKAFLEKQIGIMDQDSGEPADTHPVDFYEVSNILLLLAIYIKSSPERFQEIEQAGVYQLLVDICTSQRVLHDYFAYFIAHVASAGYDAAVLLITSGDTRSFIQKIQWNGRSVPSYELVFKLGAASYIARIPTIRKKLIEGQSVLKVCIEFVSYFCDLFRVNYDPGLVRAPPITGLMRNVLTFLKNFGKDLPNQEKHQLFGWGEVDQKLVHRLCSLLSMELVPPEVKCLVIECLTSITPSFLEFASDKLADVMADRNILVNACKVNWIHMNALEDKKGLIASPLFDHLINAIRNILVKFPYSQETEFFAQFSGLFIEATAILESSDFLEFFKVSRIESSIICLGYALQTQCIDEHTQTIFVRLFKLLVAFAEEQYDNRSLLFYTVNALCNLFTHEVVHQIDLQSVLTTLYQLMHKPELEEQTRSLLFRCLFNICVTEQVALEVLDMGYPKIIDYLDFSQYSMETFIDALFLLHQIIEFNTEAFLARTELEQVERIFNFTFMWLFNPVSVSVPDVRFGREVRDQKVLDVIISVTYNIIMARDTEILEFLVEQGYDRTLAHYGCHVKDGSVSHEEKIHECLNVIASWRKKREKAVDRLIKKYGIKASSKSAERRPNSKSGPKKVTLKSR